MTLSCFKAYDIRGKVPEELSLSMAYWIGRAFATEICPKTVVIGFDIRLESPEIAYSVIQGLRDSGVDVLDIGLCGTEEVYFATVHHQAEGGIMDNSAHMLVESS